jgi:hypothetical protein
MGVSSLEISGPPAGRAKPARCLSLRPTARHATPAVKRARADTSAHLDIVARLKIEAR